jgi:hypothetical protein
MKSTVLVVSSLLVLQFAGRAQNTFPSNGAAGIGTTSPNASSLLEVKSTSKGILIPRMTLTQRNAIASPATGLLIFQTNSTPGFYYYSGTAWTAVTQKSKGWSLTGNSGTNPSTNFIGTTDAQPLIFRINNTKAGYIDYSTGAVGLGYLSLNSNTATGNTALGYEAGYSNTSGSNNTALGNSALFANSTGIQNTATGTFALFSSTTGSNNVANGFDALESNTTASNNTAVGTLALHASNAGNNTAVGYQSLYSNSGGGDNTAVGYESLYSNSNGNNNTAVGEYALSNNTAGSSLTAVGEGANVSGGGHLFSSAFGESSIITADYQVAIGSNYIQSIGGYANWTNLSDGRVKKNIKQNVPGLEFINKLQPITYNLDLDVADQIVQRPAMRDREGKIIQPSVQQLQARQTKQQIVYSGFVAQDVEKAAKKLNYDFSGVDAAKNEHDLYGLRYSDFVVPLVKAVQELSRKNDSLNLKMTQFENLKIEQDEKIVDLQRQIDELKAMVTPGSTSNIKPLAKSGGQTPNNMEASLQQNIPNPFNQSSIIRFFVPASAGDVSLVVTDASGKKVKQFDDLSKGSGSVSIEANALSSGSYLYSLIVDGKTIATKQMILTH